MTSYTPQIQNELMAKLGKDALEVLDFASYQAPEPPPTTLRGHGGYVFGVASLPNGQVVSASSDYTLKIWDISTGLCVKTLSENSRWKWVNGVASLPNGQVVSASRDHTLKIWDISTGLCVKTLSGHSGWVYSSGVYSVASLPNGQVVSASSDHTLKIWTPFPRLSYEVIASVLAAITPACGLKTLSCQGVDLGENGYEHLLRLIKTVPSLGKVDVSDTDLTLSQVNEIQRALQTRLLLRSADSQFQLDQYQATIEGFTKVGVDEKEQAILIQMLPPLQQQISLQVEENVPISTDTEEARNEISETNPAIISLREKKQASALEQNIERLDAMLKNQGEQVDKLVHQEEFCQNELSKNQQALAETRQYLLKLDNLFNKTTNSLLASLQQMNKTLGEQIDKLAHQEAFYQNELSKTKQELNKAQQQLLRSDNSFNSQTNDHNFLANLQQLNMTLHHIIQRLETLESNTIVIEQEENTKLQMMEITQELFDHHLQTAISNQDNIRVNQLLTEQKRSKVTEETLNIAYKQNHPKITLTIEAHYLKDLLLDLKPTQWPSDYAYGLLSEQAYRNDLKPGERVIIRRENGYIERLLESNWRVYNTYQDSKTGYFSALFINAQDKHLVLAHRGTDFEIYDLLWGTHDIEADIALVDNRLP
ncbi:MAG: hypothetical protein K2Q14_05950, partial [Gammaproteobacteria bacterium]|nr:hypothetical protein [Gammaproteobacteria bacterium]